ncbi:ArnT family glycosyltransferase [Nitratidesulfovibrio oxamicus]|nr:glycosyltransferase family 39 protein [Nitratidesulfovibrio oxamicus]
MRFIPAPAPCLVAGVLLLVLTNVFALLSAPRIYDWDEARHGVTAYEMIERGDFLTNTYMGEPDYWNAKPPLSFYPIIAGYKLFGFNSLGLRFFSGVFATALLCLVLVHTARVQGTASGMLAVLMLATGKNFIFRHNARTGDPDALFLLLYVVSVLLVLQKTRSPYRFYIASVLASFAFLTKSFHAAPLVVTLAIFFFLDVGVSARSLKHAIGCLLAGLLPTSLWGWLRYRVDGTAFFKKMVGYDLLKRSSQAIEGHQADLFFYFQNVLIEFRFWMILAGVLLAASAYFARRAGARNGSYLPEGIARPFFLRLAIAAAVPMFLFTAAASKLTWYTYPSYPFLCMMLGTLTAQCIVALWHTGGVHAARIAAFGIVAVLAVAEANMLRQTAKAARDQDEVQQQIIRLGEVPDNRGACLSLRGTGWTQGRVLAAKLYGDFTPLTGKAATTCERTLYLDMSE